MWTSKHKSASRSSVRSGSAQLPNSTLWVKQWDEEISRRRNILNLIELKASRLTGQKLCRSLSIVLTTTFTALLVCIVQPTALAQQTSTTTDKAEQTTAATDDEEQM